MSDIKKILSTVDNSINGFMDKVLSVEKAMYEEILKLTKQLKVDKSGRIKNTIDNYKILWCFYYRFFVVFIIRIFKSIVIIWQCWNC